MIKTLRQTQGYYTFRQPLYPFRTGSFASPDFSGFAFVRTSNFQLAFQLINNIFFPKKQGVKGEKGNFALLPKYTQNIPDEKFRFSKNFLYVIIRLKKYRISVNKEGICRCARLLRPLAGR
jgi:hypothetical protein